MRFSTDASRTSRPTRHYRFSLHRTSTEHNKQDNKHFSYFYVILVFSFFPVLTLNKLLFINIIIITTIISTIIIITTIITTIITIIIIIIIMIIITISIMIIIIITVVFVVTSVLTSRHPRAAAAWRSAS